MMDLFIGFCAGFGLASTLWYWAPWRKTNISHEDGTSKARVMAENRRLAIEAFRNALGPEYPACWTVSKGDFSGRETTIDVFNVPVGMQREFLRRLREARGIARGLIGSKCQFIFHTPEATAEHYKDLVEKLTNL